MTRFTQQGNRRASRRWLTLRRRWWHRLVVGQQQAIFVVGFLLLITALDKGTTLLVGKHWLIVPVAVGAAAFFLLLGREVVEGIHAVLGFALAMAVGGHAWWAWPMWLGATVSLAGMAVLWLLLWFPVTKFLVNRR
jgi:hypothetical protein